MMNQSMPAKSAVNVLTIGMDSRKQAIFRMAFKMYTVQCHRLIEDAPGASPDIAIIDMDCVGAQTLWDDFRKQYPSLPTIIATVSPPENPQAPVLSKPIRMDVLFPLLRKTLAARGGQSRPSTVPSASGIAEAAPARGVVVPIAPTVSIAGSAPITPTSSGTPIAPATASPSEKVVAQGEMESHVLPESIERFDPHQGLLFMLGDIRRRRIPSVVSIAGQDAIIALPGQDNALLLQDMAAIRRACDVSSVTVSVRPLTPTDMPPPAVSQNLTALLWQTSLWTSQGRLMEGIHPETLVRLRQWPNLTRLAPIPEAMRIAAFWVRFPVNLHLTVKMLNIPPRYVFDFLAAANAIGILDVPDSGTQCVSKPPLPQPHPTAEQKERGSLLSRLLRKVVGL
jgi:hypothetical protein